MGDLGLEVGRQIDNVDGFEWAFFRADTTTNAETLGDEGDSRVRGNFDTEFTGSYDGAGLLAFLSAFLWACQCGC